MRESWTLLVLLGFVIFISGCIGQNGQDDGLEAITNHSVMQFPPLTLCQQAGGTWTTVSATDYPLNATLGIYNPTTNPSVNYRCVCPGSTVWDTSAGCV